MFTKIDYIGLLDGVHKQIVLGSHDIAHTAYSDTHVGCQRAESGMFMA
jgi:hypothetical protein